jgi:hypothetical protein
MPLLDLYLVLGKSHLNQQRLELGLVVPPKLYLAVLEGPPARKLRLELLGEFLWVRPLVYSFYEGYGFSEGSSDLVDLYLRFLLCNRLANAKLDRQSTGFACLQFISPLSSS